MGSVLLLIVLLLTACGQTISLGSECPKRNGVCALEQEAPDDGDGHAPIAEDAGDERPGPVRDSGNGEPGLDGGVPDAGRGRDASLPARDAAPPEDTGPEPGLFPEAIANRSFELTDGGVEGPLPTFEGPRPSAIAPWYNCGATFSSVQSTTRTGPQDAQQGDTFLTYALPIFSSPAVTILNGLAQNLSEPLRPGQHYAFAVDVWSESAISPVLEIAGGSLSVTGCIVGIQMGVSAPIESGGWKKVCVGFTTPKNDNVTTIMLIVNAGGNFATTLHLDNIRPDPECGNL